MKRKLLIIGTFGLLMNLQQNLNAQIFQQDFTTVTGWRNYDADGDGNSWGIGTTPYFSSQNNLASSASFDFTDGIPLTPDNYLFSTPINLSSATGTLTFAFKAGSAQTSGSGHYEEYISVYIESDTTMAHLATATPVHSEALSQGQTMISYSHDISNLAGLSEVFIVIRHHNCTFEGRLYLDDILITGDAATSTLNINCGNDHPLLIASADGNTIPDYAATTTYTSTCATEGFTITQTPTAGTMMANGINTVLITIVDGCGNTQNCNITITFMDDLGIKKLDEEIAKIYPNPVIDLLTIMLSSEIYKITVLSTDGKMMLSKYVNDTESKLDVSSLQSGLYICQLETKDGMIATANFIKK